MFNRYFQQELNHLKDLGAEFAKMHPAVAPMLSGLSTDPDVERVLEGVAFLTGLMRQKLDDDFPEIIQELFQLIWPHYLRPLPSTAIVVFSPKNSLKQIVKVPKGVQLASEPVDGTSCLFRTCYDVDVHPLIIEEATLEEKPGRPPAIRIVLSLQDLKLEEWHPNSVRFYLAGLPTQAADIFLLLRNYLKHIVLSPVGEGGEACVLAPNNLLPVGFGVAEDVIPYPSQSFPGYRIIQEYFILPEKFLFLDLHGWSHWNARGSGNRFEIRFELQKLPFAPPRVRKSTFELGATPVINLFPHDADPIRLDHRQSQYAVRPAGSDGRNYQVYGVQKVTGFIQGTARERNYSAFEAFSPDPEATPTYHVKIRQSPIHQRFDFHLSVAYPSVEGTPAPETLSMQLLCTNGLLPEGLRIGDICHPTSSTPEFVDFKNIRPPTASILPPLGGNMLWKLISNLCLNYQSLAKAENLRAVLGLYNFEENRDRSAFLANQKRIAGIQQIHTRSANRLVDRVIMRGREIQLDANQDHFAGEGDLYLFGSILDHFFGSYASMNTFIQLVIKEVLRGEVYQWPARIGDQQLI
jgi:type VI secretion system protein ImpG